ncbi:MAG TPA: lytic transglycosylase domain-containing protein [Agriterribacter sp.]|nr:lytic transglycosylase domain-containing protein [Agriterribacter sp.]
MIKMLLKGFGCFALVSSFSFTVKGKELQNNFDPGQIDTSLVTTEIVVAAAASSPSGTSTEAITVEELKTEPANAATENVALAKLAKQNMYRQLHPMSVSFVQAYQKKNEAYLEKIVTKFSRKLIVIDKIMTSYGLPADLKYLALIESELSNSAYSPKGAVGPWQFMASTGRTMGLTINRHKDERRDLTKSTHAAARYLKALYAQFNDWLLVIAAYNGGASRVESAIRKSNSRDFWKLQYYLPAESRAHVKKFVAAQFILQEADEIPLLNMEKLTAENLNSSTVLRVSGKYNTEVIARKLDMEITEFNRYNPGFDKEVVVNGYDMRLPKDKMEQFNEKREDILSESIEVMMNGNNSMIGSDTKDYPAAISLPKPKAIITSKDGKDIKRK